MVYTCRLCLRGIDSERNICPISGIDNNGVAVTTLVKTLVPEIYLGLTENPVLCFVCHDALVDAYSFRLQCLRSENLIGIFLRETHTVTPTVELQRVVNYWKNVYKTNRRDVSVAKSNLAEWFGVNEPPNEDVSKTLNRRNLGRPPKLARMSSNEVTKNISEIQGADKEKTFENAETQSLNATDTPSDAIKGNAGGRTHKALDSEIMNDNSKDLCGCPPVYDCPTNSQFDDFVKKDCREQKRKEHVDCNLLCEYRHMQTCKYFKPLVSKQQEEGLVSKLKEKVNQQIEAPSDDSVEMIIGTVIEKSTQKDDDNPDFTGDESDEDDIDINSLLQQLQNDENLEKLGLLENSATLQDAYVIKRFIDVRDNSFSYALIPKSAAKGGTPAEKSSLNEILVTTGRDSGTDESGEEETLLQVGDSVQKDGPEETTALNENLESITANDPSEKESQRSREPLLSPNEIKKEPEDEEVLKEMVAGSIEEDPMASANVEPESEKDPLDITVNKPEERGFIRVRPVEFLKQTCNLNADPLAAADKAQPDKTAPSTSRLSPNSVSDGPGLASAHAVLTEQSGRGNSANELNPIADITPALQKPANEVGLRPLFTTNSPPPLQLRTPTNTFKTKSGKSSKTPVTKVSDTETATESSPAHTSLLSFPINIEMPTLSAMNSEDQIEIKEEPLEYNDELDYFDQTLSTTASETILSGNSNLSKLINDLPMNQFDVPEYVQISPLSFISLTKLVPDQKKGKEKKQNEQKFDQHGPTVRLPQSLGELLDAAPDKSDPKGSEPPEVLPKILDEDPIDDSTGDPLYLPPRGLRPKKRDAKHISESMEVDEASCKKMRRSPRIKLPKIHETDIESVQEVPKTIPNANENRCMLQTSFTSDGDYVNDHDYFISPYARNRMASVRRRGGECCICLLCDLIHSSNRHIEHMSAHYTRCAICCADFKNVFVLNMHVRKHTSHCKECKVSVTYSRFLHHAETHNRTAGMSKIVIPQGPKFPIQEKDFLDDWEPKVAKAQIKQPRRRLNAKDNIRRSGRLIRPKKDVKKMKENTFSKMSPITLTELLKSSRTSSIIPVNIGDNKSYKGFTIPMSKRKTYSGKRKNIAKLESQTPDPEGVKKAKAVEEIGDLKISNEEGSGIIESHVYEKEGCSDNSKKNEDEATKSADLQPEKTEETQDCRENKTGSPLDESLNEKSVEKIVDEKCDQPSSETIHLKGDNAEGITPAHSNSIVAPSTKSSKPLTFKMEHIGKVNEFIKNKNLVLVKADMLKSYIKRELKFDGEGGFKLPNKILRKRRTPLKQAQTVVEDQAGQKMETECEASTSKKDNSDSNKMNSEQTDGANKDVKVKKLAKIKGLRQSKGKSPKLDICDNPESIKFSDVDPLISSSSQLAPLDHSPSPLISVFADTSTADDNKKEETSTKSSDSADIVPSSSSNLEAPPVVTRVTAKKTNTEQIDPLALKPEDWIMPVIEKPIISKEKVAKIKAYLRSNMKSSSANRPKTAGTEKLTDMDAQGLKMLEKVLFNPAVENQNAKESESPTLQTQKVPSATEEKKKSKRKSTPKNRRALPEIDHSASDQQKTKRSTNIRPSTSQDVDKSVAESVVITAKSQIKRA